MRVKHTLKPIYNENSKVLILGSMPSVTSRENNKYYAHKSNRFWQIMEIIYNEKIEDWKEFILKHNLALWDVISECDIEASSDSSIRNVVVNDVPMLIRNSQVKNIVILGQKAYSLYKKYLYDKVGIEAICLASPSSANASKSLEMLVEEYHIIKEMA